MPTFDFFNVVRKLISTAVAAVSSPVTAVLAGSALLATFLEDIVSFFGEDLNLPELDLGSIDSISGSSDFTSLFLYAVNFDTALDIIDSIVSFVSGFITFGVKFVVSFISILVSVGVYRVVRASLKDYAG